MYTDLKPFSLMGLANYKTTSEEALLSEKEMHAVLIKRDFFEKLHTKQQSVLRSENADHQKSVVLEIKLSAGGVDDHGEEEADHGGCTTPKAVDHTKQINVPPECPPPPRKPKSLPSIKRKSHDERVLLDLSNEIVSMFPPDLLSDFMNGKIKKARTESVLVSQ